MSFHSPSVSCARVSRMKIYRSGPRRESEPQIDHDANCALEHPGHRNDFPISSSPEWLIRHSRCQDQAISPWRETKRPLPAPGSSVARCTIASVPSVTVWGPL